MMRYEIAQFEEITGEKGWHTPIGEIGRFLDGYEIGCDKTIDRVLEIINTVNDDLDFGTKEKCVALSIKEKVLDLKGEQE